MEPQEQNQQNKKRVPKGLKIATIIAGAVIIFLVAAFYGLSWYGEWSLQKDVARIIEQQSRPYLEDTYGGQTPKETLELFIAAVEKDDFTLASKYFVLSEQERWAERLAGGEQKKLNNWINLLKTAEDKESLWEGNFQMDVKNEVDEIGLIIDFVKYPSGIWKIQRL